MKYLHLRSLFSIMVLFVIVNSFFCCTKTKSNSGLKITAFDCFTNSGYLNAGDYLCFSSNVTGSNTFLWNFGEGGQSTDAAPTYLYTHGGIYTVTLVVNGIPSYKATKIIDVNPLFTIANSGIPCPGHPVTFNCLAQAGSTFLWNLGDGSTSSNPSPTHIYTDTGKYNIHLTITNGISYSVTSTILIYKEPVKTNLIGGTRTWRHFSYSVFDTSSTIEHFSITYINPITIAFLSDTLTYSPTVSNDSTLVFSYNYSTQFPNLNFDNYNLYFYYDSNIIKYYRYSDEGNVSFSDNYYSP